jgi:hypothetical protein
LSLNASKFSESTVSKVSKNLWACQVQGFFIIIVPVAICSNDLEPLPKACLHNDNDSSSKQIITWAGYDPLKSIPLAPSSVVITRKSSYNRSVKLL